MAYIPTNWKNGDVITAEGLNNIEHGIVDISNKVKIAYIPTIWKNEDIITAEKLNHIENGIVNVSNKVKMAYIPTNWQNGDLIDAEKLNNIENGIVNLIYFIANEYYPDYDVVFKVEINYDQGDGVATLNTYEIIKGDFASIKNKINSGHIISALMNVKHINIVEDNINSTEFISFPAKIGYENNLIDNSLYFWVWDYNFIWTAEGLVLGS